MTAIKVLVTGATGKTGSLVLKKLCSSPDKFTTIGFARSPEKISEKFGKKDKDQNLNLNQEDFPKK